MVGLPARGKTYIARKLHRHLTWMGYKVHMCNVGNFRCVNESAGVYLPVHMCVSVCACVCLCVGLCFIRY